MGSLDSPRLPSKPPHQHQPPHNPISLVHRQPVHHLRRHRHRLSAAQHRRHGHRAPPLVEERRQRHLRRDGLVPVRDEGGEPVVVDGHAPVGVARDDGELHGGGDHRRLRRQGGRRRRQSRRRVELVDGGADDGEPRLVGPVDEPEGEDGDAG
ncbi:LOW QUALITY PROTEIN: hypothetical protein TorRG33x02_069590 [Trema orientale]|uniref:Uncharacterized protein n=1 Tax=Trema orientale TaxID=63057 RepID=A0A2P5FHD0_TREOI|nr:LOW QUALITY PROTEIN: hypothetical protein TorRG33x02_069590 [Trema orientale]